MSPSNAPPPTSAVPSSGSITTQFIRERSSTMPSSQVENPGETVSATPDREQAPRLSGDRDRPLYIWHAVRPDDRCRPSVEDSVPHPAQPLIPPHRRSRSPPGRDPTDR